MLTSRRLFRTPGVDSPRFNLGDEQRARDIERSLPMLVSKQSKACAAGKEVWGDRPKVIAIYG